MEQFTVIAINNDRVDNVDYRTANNSDNATLVLAVNNVIYTYVLPSNMFTGRAESGAEFRV